jgi:predicted flap endonuclease-1-like 5' DNA nuclease
MVEHNAGGGASVAKYLGNDAVQRALDLYLDTLPNVERQRLKPETVEGLTDTTRELAERLEILLSQIQELANDSEEERVLLYGLLKQLPVIAFEPVNYAFVGRVVIPLENVLDLLINLDVYASGKPVRKGSKPGVVELLSISEEPESPALAKAPDQSVVDIAGIGPTYSDILHKQAEIRTISDLLEQASTPEKRADLAAKTGISEKLILRWFQRADLMRIEGVGEEYGELLDHGEIRSIAELSRSNAEALYERLRMVNATRNLVQRLPSLRQVQRWIEQARELTKEAKPS